MPSGVCPLWPDKIEEIVSVLLYLVRLNWWPRMCSVLEKVVVYFIVVGWFTVVDLCYSFHLKFLCWFGFFGGYGHPVDERKVLRSESSVFLCSVVLFYEIRCTNIWCVCTWNFFQIFRYHLYLFWLILSWSQLSDTRMDPSACFLLLFAGI